MSTVVSDTWPANLLCRAAEFQQPEQNSGDCLLHSVLSLCLWEVKGVSSELILSLFHASFRIISKQAIKTILKITYYSVLCTAAIIGNIFPITVRRKRRKKIGSSGKEIKRYFLVPLWDWIVPLSQVLMSPSSPHFSKGRMFAGPLRQKELEHFSLTMDKTQTAKY